MLTAFFSWFGKHEETTAGKAKAKLDSTIESLNSLRDQNNELYARIEKMEEEMAGNGRILVRPSGTEPLLRVMAEAPTTEEVNYYVDTIAAVVKDEIGID